jgi:hypothetical protein
MMLEEEEYDIVDNCDVIDNYDSYNFIYKIDSNDICSTQSISNDDITYVAYFELIEYINDLKKSYGDELAIMTQFKKDYIRQRTKLNNVYDVNPDIFLTKLDAILKKHNYNSHNNLILLLLCQSSFVLPYTILCKFYGLINNDKILSSGSQNRIMKIDINKDNISIELNASFNIIDILAETTICKINAMITCNLKRNIDNEPQIGILAWH